jgi:NUMOD4 motif-containing protein
MIEEEIWLPIQGFEGIYEISSLGRIKATVKNQIKVLHTKSTGYITTSLYKEGDVSYFRVHRLVAQHFIPNPLNLPIINHKNSIRNDNRAVNLEWCDNSHNQLHAYKNGKIPSRNGLGKLGKDNPCSKPVLQYDLEMNFIREWDSMADIGRETKFVKQNISKVCLGFRYQAHGYIWKFKN